MVSMEQIKKEIMEQLDLSREIPDAEILAMIDDAVCRRAKEKIVPLDVRRQLQREVFYSLRRLDLLQELLEDDEITEIMVNGCGNIFYEKMGVFPAGIKRFPAKRSLRI